MKITEDLLKSLVNLALKYGVKTFKQHFLHALKEAKKHEAVASAPVTESVENAPA